MILLVAPLFDKVPSPLTCWRVCPANATLRPKVSIQNPDCGGRGGGRGHGARTEAHGPGRCLVGQDQTRWPRSPAHRRRGAGGPTPQVAPPARSAEAAASVGRGVRGHVTAAIRALGRCSPPRLLAAAPPAWRSRPPTCGCGGPCPRQHHGRYAPRRPPPLAQPRRLLAALARGSSRPEDRRKVSTGGRRAWRFLLQRPSRHPGARRWGPLGSVGPRGAPSPPSFRRMRVGASGGAAARQGRRRPGPAPGPPARAPAVTPNLFLGLRGRVSGGRAEQREGAGPLVAGCPGRRVGPPGRRPLVLPCRG